MPDDKLCAAAIQMLPAPGDPTANLARAVNLARQAAEQGARLIVFPECAASRTGRRRS